MVPNYMELEQKSIQWITELKYVSGNSEAFPWAFGSQEGT